MQPSSIISRLADLIFVSEPWRSRMRLEVSVTTPIDELVEIDLDKLVALCENALKMKLGRKNLLGSVSSELREILPIIIPLILEAAE